MAEQKYTISDIIETYISGDWGNDEPTEEASCPVSCIRGADIIPIYNSEFNNIPLRYISEKSLASRALQEGDIVIEKSGGSPTQSTGRVVYISKELLEEKQDVVCSNFCAAFRIKPEWDAKYVYYYLQHIYNAGVFFNFEGKTSGLKNLIMDTAFKSITIKKIAIETQRSIATVLSTIESKMTVNRAINHYLEAMAKQLYDYWFVQFDFLDANGNPYKSSGGKMVWNEKLKREIPEGWKDVCFKDICNVKRGASPRPIDEYMDQSHNGISWVKISDATSSESPFLTLVKEHIIPEGGRHSVHVSPNTLIVSNSASPGIPKFIEIDACVHDGWLILTGYKEYYRYYFYYIIHMIRHNLLHMASGSIFKNLKTDYLKEYVCLNPPQKVLQDYDKIVHPLMSSLLGKQLEIEELTKERDRLLALFMTGQVSVKQLNNDLPVD